MLKFLISQLDNKYKMIQEKDNQSKSFKIHKFVSNTDTIDQDTYIKLIHDGNSWNLFEGQRDKEYLLGEFVEEKVSFMALYLAATSILGPLISKPEVRSQLRDLDDDTEKAQEVLNNYIKGYYSFFAKRKEVINLVKATGNRFNVYYLSPDGEKVTVVNQAESPNVFSIVYNFGIKLKKYDEIIQKWERNTNIKLDYISKEKLRRLFLGK